MPRIRGVTAREAGIRVKLAYMFTWRAMVKSTGREAEGMLEPLQLMAHVPGLLSGYGKLEQAMAGLCRLDQRTRDLAELKAATMTNCEYCIDLGSQIARHRSGLTDGELLSLLTYQDSDLFSDLEKLVLDYAVAVSQTPVDVPDGLFARLREHFDEAQLVELTFVVAIESLRGRFNLALGIGSAGFSEGMVCAAPVWSADDAGRPDLPVPRSRPQACPRDRARLSSGSPARLQPISRPWRHGRPHAWPMSPES